MTAPLTLLLLTLLATSEAPPEAPLFVDVAAESDLVFQYENGATGQYYFAEIMGGGGAFFDFDNDGDLDVYLVQGGSLSATEGELPPGDRLFRNDLDPGAEPHSRRPRFTDVTAASGIRATGYGMGVVTGDVDNDGFVDLYVLNFGPNQLWKNDGDGTFTDVTAAWGAGDPRWSVAGSFFDHDADGFLDLAVGNYTTFSLAAHKDCYNRAGTVDYCGPMSYPPAANLLLRNRRGGGFDDVSLTSGIGREPASTLGLVAADFDDDGRTDLYEANDLMPNRLWVRLDGETFSDEALLAGCALSGDGRREAGMGVVAADLDGNGAEDLFITHLTQQTNTLYTNDGTGTFTDSTGSSGLGTPSWKFTGFGAGALDFDFDGRLDLLVANGAVTIEQDQAATGDPFPFRQPNQLFHNRGEGRFAEVTERAGEALRRSRASRGAAFGDVDNDGDTDVLIVNLGAPSELLLASGSPEPSDWLGLELITGAAPASGRPALGARVEVVLADDSRLRRRVATDGSYASASDPRILLGLRGHVARGDDSVVRAVEVRWPGGSWETFGPLEPGRYHVLRPGEGRSPSPPPADGDGE